MDGHEKIKRSQRQQQRAIYRDERRTSEERARKRRSGLLSEATARPRRTRAADNGRKDPQPRRMQSTFKAPL